MDTVVMILCWLGVFQSLLLSAYFLSAGYKSTNQFLLGLTLLMVCLRAAKSTLFLFHPDIPEWVLNIGFAAHAAIGPLLFLYVSSFSQPVRFTKILFFYFIPCFAILVGLPFLTLESFWYKGGYAALLYLTLIYTFLYVAKYIRTIKTDGMDSEVTTRWISVLLITLTLFQFSYFSNYILQLTSYSTGPIAYSLLIYVITFVVIKNNQAFQSERKKKYRHITSTDEQVQQHFEKISEVMTNQKPFTSTGFSIQKLGELAGLPSYLVSHALSTKAKQSFNSYTNSFRIDLACQMLTNKKYDHLTIAAIAYECGFSSLSSFNTAFKKVKEITPSVYKRSKSSITTAQ